MQSNKTYIPAAGSDWLLPLYDPMTKLLGLEKARTALLDVVDLRPLSRVLEIGCGTGSFCLLIKYRYPDVEVVGLDPDPKALLRARRKAERARVTIQLDQGFADSLPYDEAAFDYVFSSMMFHHLKLDEKQMMLREVRRVLKPGAVFAMLDLKKPESTIGRLLGSLFHSTRMMKDNSENRIVTLMNEAGLTNSRTVHRGTLLVGSIAYYQGSKSSWTAQQAQRYQFNNIVLVEDKLHVVEDGSVLTSAGISAGIDMALRVVTRYYGEEIGRATARHMEYPFPIDNTRRS